MSVPTSGPYSIPPICVTAASDASSSNAAPGSQEKAAPTTLAQLTEISVAGMTIQVRSRLDSDKYLADALPNDEVFKRLQDLHNNVFLHKNLHNVAVLPNDVDLHNNTARYQCTRMGKTARGGTLYGLEPLPLPAAGVRYGVIRVEVDEARCLLAFDVTGVRLKEEEFPDVGTLLVREVVEKPKRANFSATPPLYNLSSSSRGDSVRALMAPLPAPRQQNANVLAHQGQHGGSPAGLREQFQASPSQGPIIPLPPSHAPSSSENQGLLTFDFINGNSSGLSSYASVVTSADIAELAQHTRMDPDTIENLLTTASQEVAEEEGNSPVAIACKKAILARALTKINRTEWFSILQQINSSPSSSQDFPYRLLDNLANEAVRFLPIEDIEDTPVYSALAFIAFEEELGPYLNQGLRLELYLNKSSIPSTQKPTSLELLALANQGFIASLRSHMPIEDTQLMQIASFFGGWVNLEAAHVYKEEFKQVLSSEKMNQLVLRNSFLERFNCDNTFLVQMLSLYPTAHETLGMIVKHMHDPFSPEAMQVYSFYRYW